jgi:hypothetical protein
MPFKGELANCSAPAFSYPWLELTSTEEENDLHLRTRRGNYQFAAGHRIDVIYPFKFVFPVQVT